ncbi:hydrolase [Clostridium sp. AWRP]|uniref:hydrolase n=1 Tax=Clostridium sp. AWRP TaxID=2212991 RepID=UPI000FD93235|nr:hydrolase [Clostridium sp. AWRP]AZV55831.1 hydrolase [Clostridium sp. AWRP]
MNTTYCFSKIPEDLQKEIEGLIEKSGMPAKEFINALAEHYDVNYSNVSPVAIDYSNYWNSFVD